MGDLHDRRSERPMGLFDTTDLLLQRGLAGASLRQQVLSNNLANANTAGFKRSDVDFQSTLASALDTGGANAVATTTFSPVTDTTTSMRADGNNVDMDAEMAKLTSNAVEYETLTEIEKTRLGMLHDAIGTAG
jgi:flagellar basal-body rod protein FlgB